MFLEITTTWVQQQVAAYSLKQGLDKSLGFLFKRNPLIVSIDVSIQRTSSELNLEPADYLLRRAFGKNGKLIDLVKLKYKSNADVVIDQISKSLINCGANFGEDTESKVKEISLKFIECFNEELPQREKIPIYSSQTAEATHKLSQSINETLRAVSEKQDKILEIVANNEIKKEISTEVPITIQDGDQELSNSKYKKEIDEAKVLLNNEKYAAAKVIYEKLTEAFKDDNQAPTMAKFKVYNNLGSCLAALGDRPGAATNFKIAFDIIGPTSLIACKNRAMASLFENNPIEGMPYIEAAIALDPADNDSINIKATLLRASGQLDKVIELYEGK